MNQTEKTNREAINQWAEGYNTDVHRMIDENYGDNPSAGVPGIIDVSNKEDFHAAEKAVLAVAPDRKIHVLRVLGYDDTAIVESVLTYSDRVTGTLVETNFCSILTFQDGRIISDRTYLDTASWPGMKKAVSKVAN